MALYPGFADAVKFLYPGSIGRDVILQDDGQGAYLKTWGLAGSPPTNAEVDAALAQIPAAQLTVAKTAAKAVLDDNAAVSRTIRAIAPVIVSELNILRALWMSFKSATAAATSLANLQTRVAALNDAPARTESQVKQAFKDAVDAQTA